MTLGAVPLEDGLDVFGVVDGLSRGLGRRRGRCRRRAPWARIKTVAERANAAEQIAARRGKEGIGETAIVAPALPGGTGLAGPV